MWNEWLLFHFVPLIGNILIVEGNLYKKPIKIAKGYCCAWVKLSSRGSASSSGIQYPEWVFPNCWAWGGNCSSSGGTHIQHHCPTSPPHETLLCMWVGPLLDVSSGNSIHVLQVRKNLEESQDVLLNSVSEIKPGSRTRAGLERYLELWESLLCAIYSCCSLFFCLAVAQPSSFPVLMVGHGHHHQTPGMSLTSSPNATPFPRAAHSRQAVSRNITSNFSYSHMGEVRKVQFLERHSIARKNSDSSHKWITSSVTSPMLEFKFW